MDMSVKSGLIGPPEWMPRSMPDVTNNQAMTDTNVLDIRYRGLVELHDRFKASAVGFEVLAFPCNQFGQQE